MPSTATVDVGQRLELDLTYTLVVNQMQIQKAVVNSSYDCPPHVTPSTFLTGSDNFTVNEMEVFVYQE